MMMEIMKRARFLLHVCLHLLLQDLFQRFPVKIDHSLFAVQCIFRVDHRPFISARIQDKLNQPKFFSGLHVPFSHRSHDVPQTE